MVFQWITYWITAMVNTYISKTLKGNYFFSRKFAGGKIQHYELPRQWGTRFRYQFVKTYCIKGENLSEWEIINFPLILILNRSNWSYDWPVKKTINQYLFIFNHLWSTKLKFWTKYLFTNQPKMKINGCTKIVSYWNVVPQPLFCFFKSLMLTYRCKKSI